MNSDLLYQSLWDALKEASLSDIKVRNLDPSIFGDLNDDDLFPLLFKEMEDYADAIQIDKSLDKKDQLFDFFIQLSDYYSDKRSIILKLEKEIRTSPTLITEAVNYIYPILKNIFNRLDVKKIKPPSSYINACLPDLLNLPLFYGLCSYYFYLWVKESDFDLVMAKFQDMLNKFEID